MSADRPAHDRSSRLQPGEMAFARQWLAHLTAPAHAPRPLRVECVAQTFGGPWENTSFLGTPLTLAGVVYDSGLGVHAHSELRVVADRPLRRFQAVVGLDENPDQRRSADSRVQFTVAVAGETLWQSPWLGVMEPPLPVKVDLRGAREFTLSVAEAQPQPAKAHADWAEACVEFAEGGTALLARSPAELRLSPLPPLSFRYGGRPSTELLPQWERMLTEPRRLGDRTVQVLSFRDPETGLVCAIELTSFPDFPAVDYLVRFHHTGSADSPLLEDLQALDLSWYSAEVPVLYRSRGSAERVDDFQYLAEPLCTIRRRSRRVEMTSGGEGRSSVDWLPFFNLQCGEEGLALALGWSGDWAASFDRSEVEPRTRIRAGMTHTRLRLYPGESFRLPRVLLLFWRGHPHHGHNLLRQCLLRHYLPRYEARPVEAPISHLSWGGTETRYHLDNLRRIAEHRLPYEYYWVDAGWYGTSPRPCPDVFHGDWATTVGDWRVNPLYHPEGLRPISDAAHAAGLKFLLWVEPERAYPGTPPTREHPEWFLPDPDDPERGSLLLNLGHPEAHAWITGVLCRLLEEQGLDCYRQDYNLSDAARRWRAHDAPDRQGMTEIRHLEGLYALLDTLRQRFPHLLIDNCASGGRRLDLEMISRSLTLWRSDYQCFPEADPTAHQVHGFGLLPWVPLSATAPGNRWHDTYHVRSALAAGVNFSLLPDGETVLPPDYPWDWHRRMLEEYRRSRPAFYGDFYPFTACSTAPDAWLAWQLHRPDLDEGLVVAYRRPESLLTRGVFPLQGLTPGAEYEFEDADTGERLLHAAADLQAGFTLDLPEPRSSRLLWYRRVCSTGSGRSG